MGKKSLIFAGIIIGLLGIYIFMFYHQKENIDQVDLAITDTIYDILKDEPEKIKESQYFITKGENSTSQPEITIKNKEAIIKFPIDEEMSDPQKDITGRNAILLFSMYPKLQEVYVSLKDENNKYHPITRKEGEMYIGKSLNEKIDNPKDFKNFYNTLENFNFTKLWVYENEEKIEPTKDIVKAIRQGLKQIYPQRDIGQPEILCFAWHELGSELKNGQYKLYLLVHYEGYNFINDDFISVLGADEYVVLALNKKKDGEYSYGYGIRSKGGMKPYDIIPEDLIVDFDPEKYTSDLANETYEQAKAYVAQMGRESKVYQASKAPTRKYISSLLHDGGKSFPKGFPLFPGSIEYLIGPRRYIYTPEYDGKTNEVILTISDIEGNILDREEYEPILE